MACIIQFAPSVTMATTQLARVIPYEPAVWPGFEANTENTPLRMNWVVVTDSNGARQLRMRWEPTQPQTVTFS